MWYDAISRMWLWCVCLCHAIFMKYLSLSKWLPLHLAVSLKSRANIFGNHEPNNFMLHETKLRFNKFTLIVQYHSLLSVHWVLSNKHSILSPKIETCCVITGLVFLSGKKIFRFSELATPHYIGARAQWQNRKIIIKKVFKINEADHSGTVPEQFFMCHRKRGHKRHVFLWLFDWSYWHVHSVTQ